MKIRLWVVLLPFTILGLSACRKEPPPADQISLTAAAERIRAFAEEKNPEFRDQPLVAHLSRRRGGGGGGVCVCIQVCTKGGRCTACVCDPPKCAACFSAAQFESAAEAPQNAPEEKSPPMNPQKQ